MVTGRPANGARRLVDSSLKFIVVSVFINGKMAVSLPATELGGPGFIGDPKILFRRDSDYKNKKNQGKQIKTRTCRHYLAFLLQQLM